MSSTVEAKQEYEEAIPIVEAVQILAPATPVEGFIHDLADLPQPSAPLEEEDDENTPFDTDHSLQDHHQQPLESQEEEKEEETSPEVEEILIDVSYPSESTRVMSPPSTLEHQAVLVASGVATCMILGPLWATTALGAVYVHTCRPTDSLRAPEDTTPAPVLVVHQQRRPVLRQGVDQVGNWMYSVIENLKPTRDDEQVIGASVTTALLAGLLGGPICAVVAGCGTAALACQEDGRFMGDTARAVGQVALTARDQAKEINQKHRVLHKVKRALRRTWHKARKVEKEHALIKRTQTVAVYRMNEAGQYLLVHVWGPGKERLMEWLRSISDTLTTPQQLKSAHLAPVLVGVEQ